MNEKVIALGALSALLSGSAIAAETIEEQQRRGLEYAQSLSPKEEVSARFIDDRTASATVRIPLRDLGFERVTTTEEAIDVATSMIALLEPLYDTDTRTLVVQQVTPYGEGFIVGFTQRFGDVDVVGAHLRVLIVDDAVQGIVGRTLGDEVGFAGRFDADDAVEIAVAAHGGGHARVAPQKTIVAPTFIWSDAERAVHEIGREPRGAWRVVVESHPTDKEQNGGAVVFIDAHSGQVLLTSTERREIDLLVRGNGNMLFLCLSTAAPWFNNSGRVPGSSPSGNGVTAFNSLHDYHTSQAANFGRLSWNDRDGLLNALVDIHDANVVNNAYFDPFCDHAVFSPTMMAPDVVAHELGHATTHAAVGFIYQGQSGALDEHWGDFNGALVDNNSTLGEATRVGTFRDMLNPQTFGHPGRNNDFVNTTNDNGGVHSNSGIPNKAAALLMFGGTHNGFRIQRVSRPVHTDLWAATTLTSSPTETFQQWADFLLLLSDNSQRTSMGFSITARTRCDIRNALASVDLAASDFDCDGVIEPRGDRDRDGHPDEVDNCRDDFNFGQADWDHDGLGNVCDPDDDNDGLLDDDDNCPGVPNRDQQDNYGSSGRGDACDDVDDDWINDANDNCPTAWNAGQEDNDGDGVGDECEADSDGDGIDDDRDNCRLVANPFQDDTDGDGIGDSCDFCWYTPGGEVDTDGDGIGDDCDDDIDGDGFRNEEDNCPEDANNIQIDVDGDGMGDVCDQLPTWSGDRLEVILRHRDEWFSRHISTFDPCFSGICDLEVDNPMPTPHGGLIVITEIPVFARVLDGDGTVLDVVGPATELPLEWVTPNGLRGTPSLELWRQEPGGGDIRAQIMAWR